MVDKNFHTAKPNSAIWEMFSAILSSSFCCLINTAILSNMMFLVSPSRYSFIPKRDWEKAIISQLWVYRLISGIKNDQQLNALRSTHVVGFIHMWNMHGYFRIHRNIHPLLYYHVRKKQCLCGIIVHLFGLCRVVGHGLNSLCIVHRQYIRVYRRFSKGVRARYVWPTSSLIHFNIHLLRCRRY